MDREHPPKSHRATAIAAIAAAVLAGALALASVTLARVLRAPAAGADQHLRHTTPHRSCRRVRRHHRRHRCRAAHRRLRQAGSHAKDTTPPSAPGNLTVTAGDQRVSLSWGVSTDPDSPVAGYRVYREGAKVAQLTGTTYADTGLTDGTSYRYYVVAYDRAGNVSNASSIVTATPQASSSTTSWDPSGEAMPVGNISGWNQIFADNFANDDVPVGAFSGCSWPNGATIMQINCTGLAAYPNVEAKWFAYPDGWPDTTKNGTYYPSKVMSIQNGIMNLHLHTETINGTTYHMVSAPVPKIPGGTGSAGGSLYGRYAIRFRADSLHGYKTAWLLWADSNTWPQDGEIDFPEGDLDGTINAYLHWMNGTSGSSQDAFPTNVTYNAWHTAVLTWSPLATTFALDGNLVGEETNVSLIPNTPMHWVIQTETATDGTGPPADSTAGNVQIDWVTAYAPAS